MPVISQKTVNRKQMTIVVVRLMLVKNKPKRETCHNNRNMCRKSVQKNEIQSLGFRKKTKKDRSQQIKPSHKKLNYTNSLLNLELSVHCTDVYKGELLHITKQQKTFMKLWLLPSRTQTANYGCNRVKHRQQAAPLIHYII